MIRVTMLGLLLCALLCVVPIDAAIHYPATCSYADVNQAHTDAVNGDTILMPPGTCVWSTALAITKYINLFGSGIGQTIISSNLAGGNARLIQVLTSAGGMVRVGYFSGQYEPGISGTFLLIKGSNNAVRIHHLRITASGVGEFVFLNRGAGFVLLDHIDLEVDTAVPFIEVYHDEVFYPTSCGSECHGDGAWAQPAFPGTNYFLFVEDSRNWRTTDGQTGRNDAEHGARVVWRYNTQRNGAWNCHGTENGRKRGCRYQEVYGNHFVKSVNAQSLLSTRSGGWIVYDNTIATESGASVTGLGNLKTYRAFFNSSVTYDGACAGLSVYDNNDPVLYDSGTHTGVTSPILTDNTKNWSIDQWQGYSVLNLDAVRGPHHIPSGSFVDANTATTLEARNAGTADSLPDWETGHRYEIRRINACLDGLGMGQSALITGSPPSPAAWPNQVIEPLYEWNNVVDGVLELDFDSAFYGSQEGVHFFTDERRPPGYTPYTYPHPLRQEAASGYGMTPSGGSFS